MTMLSNNAIRRANSTVAPAKSGHAATAEREIFCKPVKGLDSWRCAELLEMDTRTLLAAGVVDPNDANSCSDAMAFNSLVEIDSARGFGSSIAVFCVMLDKASM